MLYVILTNLLAVVVVLGIMILMHELGHFLAAKYFGVRVEVFSFGFGKRLLGFKKGDTDYRVSLLPLGGYVKMAGETTSDEVTGNPDEFQSKPRWQRFIVAAMGPAMNILLAIVLLTGLFMYRYQKPAYQEGPAVIGYVRPDSPAAAAEFEVGDRIVRMDGQPEPTWGDVELIVASTVERPLVVEIERNGELETRTLVPRAEGRARLGYAGWSPRMPAKIQAVAPGFPAAEVALMPGDEIVSINATPIPDWPMISELVRQNEGKPLEIVYLRNGEQRTAQVTPVLRSVEGETEPRWRIGVDGPQMEMITRRLGFAEALSESLATNKKFALLIFEFVGKIFSQELSPRTLEGPIGIARLSGAAARHSLEALVSLTAAISLNLGIFNLFPIPVLDGGLILLLLIEGAIRRDLSRKVKERVTQVGFAFLMLIAVFVIYNDIVKSLPESFDRFLP